MKREELLKALEIVKPGLASREILEQSNSFAFMNGYVVTYNDELSICHPVEGLNITGAVRAEELYQLLNKLRKEDIEIEISGAELLVKSGRAHAGIVVQSEIKLPLEEIGKIGDWKPLPDTFAVGIKFTLPSTGKDLSNNRLTCLHIRTDGLLEASDNYRITRYRVADALPVKNNLLLPSASASQIVKYSLHQVAESKGWIHFQTEQGGTIISCRTFEGEFPDTTAFFKVEGTKFELPKTLDEVLSRAQIFGTREQATVEEVEISLEKNRIKVRGANEYGWFEETANVAYAKEPISFTVNPSHLKTIVGSIHSCILAPNCLKFEGETWQHIIALKAAK